LYNSANALEHVFAGRLTIEQVVENGMRRRGYFTLPNAVSFVRILGRPHVDRSQQFDRGRYESCLFEVRLDAVCRLRVSSRVRATFVNGRLLYRDGRTLPTIRQWRSLLTDIR
jgi:hypothetical protein